MQYPKEVLKVVEEVAKVRNALVEYFKEKAQYRNSLAENQEPYDGPKNESYAASLELVANYVAALPDDNPTLKTLADCDYLFSSDRDAFFAPQYQEGLSLTDSEAIHCGPRGAVMDPTECAKWFESWAQTALDEYPESVTWMETMFGCDDLP